MPREQDPVVGVDDFLAAVIRAVSRAEEVRSPEPGGSVERRTVLAHRPIVTLGLTYQSMTVADDALPREADRGADRGARDEKPAVPLRVTHEDAARADRIAESIQQVPFQENIAKVWQREAGAADQLAASIDTLGAVADSHAEFAISLVGQLDDAVLENLMLTAGVPSHNMTTLKGVAQDRNVGLAELLTLNSTANQENTRNGETLLSATFQRGAGIALVGASLLGVAAITRSPVAAGAGAVLVVVGAALMLQ
ncbi:hypothetical protein ACFXAW_19955 [Streptomyces sp. NPDC059445]|uniref:hypothetical protein n=1 Tax=Streptomyces sp. NPDC059445 TaxID=3346832 RepID=UPI003693CC20